MFARLECWLAYECRFLRGRHEYRNRHGRVDDVWTAECPVWRAQVTPGWPRLRRFLLRRAGSLRRRGSNGKPVVRADQGEVLSVSAAVAREE